MRGCFPSKREACIPGLLLLIVKVPHTFSQRPQLCRNVPCHPICHSLTRHMWGTCLHVGPNIICAISRINASDGVRTLDVFGVVNSYNHLLAAREKERQKRLYYVVMEILCNGGSSTTGFPLTCRGISLLCQRRRKRATG